jgi:hypothetical protein
MKKIYTDDPRVKYVSTSIAPERTREEISEKLRAYDTYDIYWHWRPEQSDVYVQFIIEEVIDGVPVKVGAKVVMPIIWDKSISRSPNPKRRIEQVNLAVSMRAMFWYIKANLENAYAMQSSRVAAFLPDTVQPNGKRMFDNLKLRLDQFAALPEAPREKPLDVEVIVPKRSAEKRERIIVTNEYREENQDVVREAS